MLTVITLDELIESEQNDNGDWNEYEDTIALTERIAA